MNGKTRKLTAAGILCALAYTAAAVGRVPMVLFLKYDPKDIVIALGGMLYGPLTAFAVALTASFVELFTVSDNGILGFLMNVISSCSFGCAAAYVYKRRGTFRGAAAGLLCGWACMVLMMLLWNCLVTPIYMGRSREEVLALLLPVFLPFNLIKGGLNAAGTLLLYRPIVELSRRKGGGLRD